MNSIEDVFQKQRENQWALRRRSAPERIERLKKLRSQIMQTLPDLREALVADLNKNSVETDITEVAPVLLELQDIMAHLSQWMRPRKVRTPLLLMGSTSRIQYEAKGLVLILGTWNYPFALMITPLIAALAAGNSAILKPSEFSPRTSHYLTNLIRSVFDESEVAVVEGDGEIAKELLSMPFDHIFFTGSTRVGKLVMTAAAKNLTPITLELGGKSPAFVFKSADLITAAERIVWGKFINSGQTCVAPDFVVVDIAVKDAFLNECRRALSKFYGHENGRLTNPDICRIVNKTHFQRLRDLLTDSISRGGKIEAGGQLDESLLRMAPTIMTNIKADYPIMGEEIFGPILPVLTFEKAEDAYPWVRSKGKPLASYIFSENEIEIEEFTHYLPAGGTSVNTTVSHFGNPWLPFGGLGESGVGSYHGEFGFRAFSHERAVLRQGRFESISFLRPPYNHLRRRLVDWLLKFLNW